MHLLCQLVTCLNVPANAIGNAAFGPAARLPGWLSHALISALAGMAMLIVYKHTSNQAAIRRVRDALQADLMALKLFKESAAVTLGCQGRLLKNALWLLVYSLPPLLVMLVPMALVLGQMGLWYQAQPLAPGQEVLVTLTLAGTKEGPWPKVAVEPSSVVHVTAGPVRIISKREICWQIQALRPGYHRLSFHVGDQRVEKELAVGDGVMRASLERPGWQWQAILIHPAEAPFPLSCPVRSIRIDYPPRVSRTCGTDSWLICFFLLSTAFALAARPFFNVRF